MKNAIFFAVYLPTLDKVYVLEECISHFHKAGDYDLYIGIEYGSHSSTKDELERILKDRDIQVYVEFVTENLTTKSDAGSFQAALNAYKFNNYPDYDLCYFLHTKSITTGYDQLRSALLHNLFLPDVKANLDRNVYIGSFGPILTITNVEEDIKMLSIPKVFNETVLKFEPMHYYYLHTFYILKGHLVKKFLNGISDEFFSVNLKKLYNTEKDSPSRYFFERDFIHLVDMQGYAPTYIQLGGNYSTQFVPPTVKEFEIKLRLWQKGLIS